MDTWQEAETGQQQKVELQLTTDDLVLWLGEAFINDKQQKRLMALQQQKMQKLEAENLKLKSLSMGENTKFQELTAEFSKLKDENQILNENQHTQIVNLEEQIHTVALERDATIKQYDLIRNEFEQLKSKKKK